MTNNASTQIKFIRTIPHIICIFSSTLLLSLPPSASPTVEGGTCENIPRKNHTPKRLGTMKDPQKNLAQEKDDGEQDLLVVLQVVPQSVAQHQDLVQLTQLALAVVVAVDLALA